MILMKAFFILSLLFMTSCKKEGINIIKSKVVVGNNTFAKVDRTVYPVVDQVWNPWDRIGLLEIPQKKRTCTAFYVGDRYAVTATHCILKSGLDEILYGNYQLKFAVKKDGSAVIKRRVTAFFYKELKWLRSLRDVADHWAILELDRPLNDEKRFFSLIKPKDTYNEDHHYNFDLRIGGYSEHFHTEGKVLTYSQDGCRIHRVQHLGKVLRHDCDAGAGDSGAPLFKCKENQEKSGRVSLHSCHIVGMHVGAIRPKGNSEVVPHLEFYSHRTSNLASGVMSFYSAIYWLRVQRMRGVSKPSYLRYTPNF